ncbi:helix-turn-helix domain-containing protein [Bradyrhizobium tunisiense]|uniref:helix-turn-helix domain-containing protein n=1 Tax=Bradyrhizobium tunisiense TaxID=3278709 RepID=UPI0035E18180
MNIHMSPQDRTIAQQRVRIECLEEELRQLRSSLAPVTLFPIEWKLTATQQRLVAAFYKSNDGFLTHDQVFLASGSSAEEADNLVKVQIMHLRKKVAPLGIEINKRWGQGYEMTAKSKSIIKAALEVCHDAS